MLNDGLLPLILIVSILATILTANYIIRVMMQPIPSSHWRSLSVFPDIELNELPDYVDPELVHE